MGAELVDGYSDGSILVNELDGGQLGVVTNPIGSVLRIGDIVQRTGDRLFYIGSNISWGDLKITKCEIRVKVLPRGTLIRIT